MDEKIRNTAKEIVDTVLPFDEDEDEDDEELNRENAEFMRLAVPMMREALDRWRAEHGPNAHGQIHATLEDDGTIKVVITPDD